MTTESGHGDPFACAKHSFWQADCSLCDATRSGFERGQASRPGPAQREDD